MSALRVLDEARHGMQIHVNLGDLQGSSARRSEVLATLTLGTSWAPPAQARCGCVRESAALQPDMPPLLPLAASASLHHSANVQATLPYHTSSSPIPPCVLPSSNISFRHW